MPPRVVVDSNVIVSALSHGGKPDQVIRLAEKGQIELYLSSFIIKEVTVALISRKFQWDPERVKDALLGFRRAVVEPGLPRLHVVPDDADNRILECGIAADADYIVTGDRGLLELGTYRNVRILNPHAFLREIVTRR